MKAGSGKGKGGAFERKICKALSLWVTHGDRDDVFWRSAMSGGRATVRRKKGKSTQTQVGDISPVDAVGQPFIDIYVVECKHYNKLDIESAVIQGNGKLVEFWDKLVIEAKGCNKLPMLIAKQNNRPVLVCVCKRSIKTVLRSYRLLEHKFSINHKGTTKMFVCQLDELVGTTCRVTKK